MIIWLMMDAKELVEVIENFRTALADDCQLRVVLVDGILIFQVALRVVITTSTYRPRNQGRAYRLSRGFRRCWSDDVQVTHMVVDVLRYCVVINPKHDDRPHYICSLFSPASEILIKKRSHAPLSGEALVFLLKIFRPSLQISNQSGCDYRCNTADCLYPCRPYLTSFFVHHYIDGIKTDPEGRRKGTQCGDQQPNYIPTINSSHIKSPVVRSAIVGWGAW